MGSTLTGTTAAVLLAMYGHDPTKASIMGFALSQALPITQLLSTIIQCFTSAETRSSQYKTTPEFSNKL